MTAAPGGSEASGSAESAAVGTSAEFLSALADWFNGIGLHSVLLQSIRKAPTVQERLPVTSVIDCELQDARSFRERYGVPFWEALLLAVSRTGNVDSGLLRGAGYQHEDDSLPVLTPVSALPGLAGELRQKDQAGETVAVLSAVQVDREPRRHLAMVDFRLPADAENIHIVRELARYLGGGLLVDSGNSYHLYGTQLHTQEAFHAFLGLAAQFNPLVDGRWTAHQHRAGRAALRISPRAGLSPRFLEVIDPP